LKCGGYAREQLAQAMCELLILGALVVGAAQAVQHQRTDDSGASEQQTSEDDLAERRR
jgi:hypothetical protein